MYIHICIYIINLNLYIYLYSYIYIYYINVLQYIIYNIHRHVFVLPRTHQCGLG